ncbi:hypothetical protein PISMIDRAFT_681806 [Pisolithus microcarpus 441]|uniref:Uncharacterized protein n=1 Tax=Pisolithus microcarpus 441 TaxID=765257 RepID=A0A0C9ZEW2_9AGAM|nr:hypothetical protein PISMIDRAFT_681806 [Pisolithus microcarpus 441]
MPIWTIRIHRYQCMIVLNFYVLREKCECSLGAYFNPLQANPRSRDGVDRNFASAEHPMRINDPQETKQAPQRKKRIHHLRAIYVPTTLLSQYCVYHGRPSELLELR